MRLPLLLLIPFMLLARPLQATPALFGPESFQQILAQYHDNNVIVLLWSLDCPPCIEELPTIQRFHHENPDVKLVMISADNPGRGAELDQLLQQHRLDHLPQWVFNSEEDMRLRYSIDPGWYGELPRSYLYIQGRQVAAASGRITQAQLAQWLKQVR